jgi:hypothetical protein
MATQTVTVGSAQATQTQTPVSPTPATGAVAPVSPQPAKPVYPSVDDVVKVTKAPRNNVAQNLPFMLKAMAEKGLISRNQLIGIIATVGVETPFKSVREDISVADATADYDGILGNGRGNGDGYKYRGAGYIQLTGKANFEAAERDLKIPIVANPDLAIEPANSAKLFVWFWMGGSGQPSAAKAAERGDWWNVRVTINGINRQTGKPNGWEKFMAMVNAASQVFTQGIDPAAIGVMPLPDNFGTNCIDGGIGASRDIAGNGVSVSSQADAIAIALGLMNLDRQKAIKFEALMNPQEYPELLGLEVQNRFQGKNFGDGLDGELTVEQISIYCGGSLEMNLTAFQPDPNAPPLQVFAHSASLGANHNTPTQNAAPIGGSSPVQAPAGSILIPVPYISQRDAKVTPWRVCNTASSAMCAQFLGKREIGVDQMYELLPGDTTDHGVQVAALAKIGIKCVAGNIGFEELDAQINQKRPVCIGILHKGPISAPYGGHVLVVIGRTPNGDFVVNDPWGDLNTGYASPYNGAGKIYTRQELKIRWTVSHPKDGVARWFPV